MYGLRIFQYDSISVVDINRTRRLFPSICRVPLRNHVTGISKLEIARYTLTFQTPIIEIRKRALHSRCFAGVFSYLIMFILNTAIENAVDVTIKLYNIAKKPPTGACL